MVFSNNRLLYYDEYCIMSPNRRIILNIAVTYGRSLVGLLCGIFSTRWVLMALGHESFGLFGVVGSLVLFVSFLNIQFSSALSRFYAFSIGKANAALDKMRHLMNVVIGSLQEY